MFYPGLQYIPRNLSPISNCHMEIALVYGAISSRRTHSKASLSCLDNYLIGPINYVKPQRLHWVLIYASEVYMLSTALEYFLVISNYSENREQFPSNTCSIFAVVKGWEMIHIANPSSCRTSWNTARPLSRPSKYFTKYFLRWRLFPWILNSSNVVFHGTNQSDVMAFYWQAFGLNWSAL